MNLAPDDGKLWTPCYDNKGKAFGGITDHKPLVVDFGSGGQTPLAARYLRIQLPSPTPIFMHFDEVEVYAPGDAAMQKNLGPESVGQPSSRSPWSRGGDLLTLGSTKIGLAGRGESAVVTLNGKPLAADRAKMVRAGRMTSVEMGLNPDTDTAGFPTEVAPFHSHPTPLAAARDWQIVWPAQAKLGSARTGSAWSYAQPSLDAAA